MVLRPSMPGYAPRKRFSRRVAEETYGRDMISCRGRPVEAGFDWRHFNGAGRICPSGPLRPFSTTIPRRHDRIILEATK